MPQSDTVSVSRRRATWRGPRKANGIKVNGVVDGKAPGTGLANGAFHRKHCTAAAGGAGDSRPAGTLNATKPLSTVNGDEAKKTAPPKNLRRHGGSISALTDVPVNGSTSPQNVGFPRGSDRVVPDANQSAAATNRKKRNKFRWKKSNHELANPVDPRLAPMPPQVEENWENEIQEVSSDNWRKMCFGNAPFGPEDVLSFALRDLTLRETAALPVGANYRPAHQHPRPLKWTRYKTPTEPGQFADADE